MASSRNALNGVFIDGKFVETGQTMTSIDPSSGKVWTEIVSGGADEVAAAASAARAAFRAWSRQGPWERSAVLRRLADLVRARAEELATLESMDNGKPITTTREEIARGVQWLEFFSGAAQTVHGQTIRLEDGWDAQIHRLPVGVVGAITPWNSPFYLYLWKLAPALAMGNTVVLKPSDLASASSVRLAELIVEAGFPPGVVNIVAGPGAAPGAALTENEDIDFVTFTGSAAVGRIVAAAAARRFKRSTIEAGGKAALIVLDDADMDLALSIALTSGFRSAGQSCAQSGRVLVHASRADEFAERLVQGCSKLLMGPPLDEGTLLGPMITAEAVERVEATIQSADWTYDILCGGAAVDCPAAPGGFFFPPTVVHQPDPLSPLFQDELFGPVVGITSFDTDDEAMALANSVEWGLASAVIGRDVNRLHRFVTDLEVGSLSINGYRTGHWLLPYGGRKSSGMGVDNGIEAMYTMSQVKTVVSSFAR